MSLGDLVSWHNPLLQMLVTLTTLIPTTTLFSSGFKADLQSGNRNVSPKRSRG